MTNITSPADVIAPAPWSLTGQGYIFAVLMPKTAVKANSFMPETIAESHQGRIVYAMFVDYSDSDVGPYYELLYIPGSFQFASARRLSITKIYVSSQASVTNGQRNWGIPKELCDCDVDYGADNQDRIVLKTQSGHVFADIQLSHHLFKLPMPGHLVPEGLRTLGQHWDGKEFSFAPEANGHVKLARVKQWQFDPQYFPDLAQGRVLSALKVTDFSMIFGTSQVSDIA